MSFDIDELGSYSFGSYVGCSDDSDGAYAAPPGFIRHSDGHLSPDLYSSEYDRALKAMENYVKHASYALDAYRGKPKGGTMEVINEAYIAQNYQYEALSLFAQAIVKEIEHLGHKYHYSLPDPIFPDYGHGDPDFREQGWVAAQSTLEAIRLGMGQ